MKHSCSFSCPIDSYHFYFQIVKLQFIIQYTQFMCVWYSVWMFSATIQTLHFTNTVVWTCTVPTYTCVCAHVKLRMYVTGWNILSNPTESFGERANLHAQLLLSYCWTNLCAYIRTYVLYVSSVVHFIYSMCAHTINYSVHTSLVTY